MTIVVFDTEIKKAYADSRTSLKNIRKNRFIEVSSEKTFKIKRVGRYVCGFAGNSTMINQFIKSLNKKPIQNTNSSFLGVLYDIHSDKFFKVNCKKNSNNKYIISTIIMSAIVSALFGAFSLTLAFWIMYNIAICSLNKYRVIITPLEKSTVFIAGSGTRYFWSRYMVYENTADSIKEVGMHDRFCNEHITEMDISGRLFNEDIH